MKKQVKTNKAPEAPGMLSQAIITNDWVFTSGYINATKPGWTIVKGSIEEQFRAVMTNIKEVLKAAGLGLDDVVKVTLYVTDIKILPEINKFYPTYFTEPFPVREAIGVKALPLGASIEMSVVAKR